MSSPIDIAWMTETMGSPTIREFLRLFHAAESHGMGWTNVRWRGHVAVKIPTDLWMMMEIIQQREPTLLIETGTEWGGSALFYADCGLEVITIDQRGIRDFPTRPQHPKITYLQGDSTDPGVAGEIVPRLRSHRVMVVLDSDHAEAHVAKELALWAPFVSPKQYLVVEDTWLDWALETPWKGPLGAVEAFLKDHPEFRQDRTCERFLLTMHPGGWLERAG